MPDVIEQNKRTARARQLGGAEGVFLVCAELARRGFVVSPTSRNAKGADILVTNADCTRAFTVEVKTNTATANFWLVDKPDRPSSPSLVYILVNLYEHKRAPDFYVVPSADLRAGTKVDKKGEWPSFNRDERYKDNWAIFGQSPSL